jgi:hypothetical protein
VLVVISVVLGFQIAAAGVTAPPAAGEVASLPDPVIPSDTGPAATVVVEDRPLGDAPSSAEDALTRVETDAGGLPRLTFITADGDSFIIDNGEPVSLGGGFEVTVALDPYPADRFDVTVDFALSRDGVPVSDATFDTTWDMTFMYHGPFETRHLPTGGGYSADYEFFMFGPWRLDTVVTTPDDRHEFAVSIYVWPN